MKREEVSTNLEIIYREKQHKLESIDTTDVDILLRWFILIYHLEISCFIKSANFHSVLLAKGS